MSEKDYWEGYVPEPDKRQQALDKKAENARELGLDYEPAQEPCCYGGIAHDCHAGEGCRIVKRMKATSPQRTWVKLEGEEIRNLWEEATKPDRSTMTMVTSFARAIEAKLKERNFA